MTQLETINKELTRLNACDSHFQEEIFKIQEQQYKHSEEINKLNKENKTSERLLWCIAIILTAMGFGFIR